MFDFSQKICQYPNQIGIELLNECTTDFWSFSSLLAQVNLVWFWIESQVMEA